jgi:hypothetical protein
VRRKQAGGGQVPDWIRHEYDGGFVVSDWAEPADFAADPGVAESSARQRWIAARNAWLAGHLDVADVLLGQLRDLCAD